MLVSLIDINKSGTVSLNNLYLLRTKTYSEPSIYMGIHMLPNINMESVSIVSQNTYLVPLLLIWFNFNPSMDK